MNETHRRRERRRNLIWFSPRIRFSLRAMLVAVTGLGVVAGLLVASFREVYEPFSTHIEADVLLGEKCLILRYGAHIGYVAKAMPRNGTTSIECMIIEGSLPANRNLMFYVPETQGSPGFIAVIDPVTMTSGGDRTFESFTAERVVLLASPEEADFLRSVNVATGRSPN